MSEERRVQHHVEVAATSEMAFEAVTRASELREWFSDEAWTEVRVGGRFEVRWNRGYRAAGRFTVAEPPRQAAVTWQGTGEPGETAVTFSLEPAGEGTRVSVVHSGFGAGADWDRAVAESDRGWQTALENLKSTLETGVDLRIVRRPFLGITFEALNAERAAKEHIPVDRGIYVLGTVEGSGARAAGLERGDVIASIGATETPGYYELGLALGERQAGERVEMRLLRGGQWLTVPVTLGQRPQEEVPDTIEGLVEQIVARRVQINADLTAAVNGLTDEEAGRRPAEGEWSVKEVLAHLSLSERDQQVDTAMVATSGWVEGYADLPGRLDAVIAIAPTLPELLARLVADQVETVVFLRHLPPQVAAHKARFHRIAQTVGYLPNHTCEHIDQIKATIKAVRGQ